VQVSLAVSQVEAVIFSGMYYSVRGELASYQKGSFYKGTKQFNCLPLNLKQLYKDVKRFKLKLKEYLSCHSFYTLDEYFEYSSWRD
jgi:hypothetical protein